MGLQNDVKLALTEDEEFTGRVEDRTELLGFPGEHGEFAYDIPTTEISDRLFFLAVEGDDPDAAGADQKEVVDRVAFAQEQQRAFFVGDWFSAGRPVGRALPRRAR